MSGPTHLQAVPSAPAGAERPAQQAPAGRPRRGPGDGGDEPPTGGGRTPGKARPDRGVPTDRMRFDRQVAALRMYAQLSGPAHQPVGADYLGRALEVSAGTAGLCAAFFKDSGWVVRTGRGAHAATDALLDFQRRLNTDPGDLRSAVASLAGPARRSWYWAVVEPLLTGGVRRSVLLIALSQAAGAHDHRPQLLLLLDWLQWLGLVRREGELLHSVGPAPDADAPDDVTPQELAPDGHGAPDGDGAPDGAPHGALDDVPADGRSAREWVDDTPEPVDTGALVSFSFSVRITAQDAATLSHENIAAVLAVIDRLRGQGGSPRGTGPSGRA